MSTPTCASGKFAPDYPGTARILSLMRHLPQPKPMHKTSLLKIQSSPKCPTRGRRSAMGKSSPCGIVSKARKKICSHIWLICKQEIFSATQHNQRLGCRLFDSLVEWLVVISVGMKWGKQAIREAGARKSGFLSYSRKIASGGSTASRRVPSHPASITTSIPPSPPTGQMMTLA